MEVGSEYGVGLVGVERCSGYDYERAVRRSHGKYGGKRPVGCEGPQGCRAGWNEEGKGMVKEVCPWWERYVGQCT